ncbi:replication initiation protein [Persicobacter diffluens]|uniref:Initiator Rep protein WH1 domain-containing protein n=1 Tax=Persicobacter diffluens TaxID=981 RepID=A0AAN4W561_9BACT|nr:hypothetical protein PEDI_55960 [Persicobacter diffluens]
MNYFPKEYSNYRIVKHNKLVNAKEDLSLTQHRIIMLLASRLTKEDISFKEHRINIRDVLGIKSGDRIGSGYDRVRKAAIGLTNTAIYIEEGDKWISFPLITLAQGNKREDFIRVRFANEMKPFLLQLKEGNYTQYLLQNVYKLQSVYSVRFYELFQQFYPKIQTRSLSYQRLRELLNLGTKYQNHYPSFKRRVLEVAINEINEYTDLLVCYEEVRLGRKIDTIIFNISANPSAILKEEDELNIRGSMVLEGNTLDIDFENCSTPTEVPESAEATEASDAPVITGNHPSWVKQSAYKAMVQKYGQPLVDFAISKIEGKEKVSNPMGYLYKGLKEEWWGTEWERERLGMDSQKKQQERILVMQSQEEMEEKLKEQFGVNNKRRRKEIFAVHDSEEERSEYVLELEFNEDFKRHRQLYLKFWESEEGPNEDALIMYQGWLLKKYGEPKDWDLKIFMNQHLNPV